MPILILAEILRSKRKSKNLTLQALSDLTDISISELSNLERGKVKEPSCVFLYRICNVLELNYNEMLQYRYESYYRKKELYNA